MKKNWKIILLIIAVVLLVIGFIFLLPKHKSSPKDQIDENNFYKYSEETTELEGTEVITNDRLKDLHCLDRICISDVEITYLETFGRVDYTVWNRGSKKESGYLKLNFGTNTVLVSYQDLKPDQKISSSYQFFTEDFHSVTDYTIEKLTKEEKKAIVSK